MFKKNNKLLSLFNLGVYYFQLHLFSKENLPKVTKNIKNDSLKKITLTVHEYKSIKLQIFVNNLMTLKGGNLLNIIYDK